MKEVCAACLIEVDSDTKICVICQEPVGTIELPETCSECDHVEENSLCQAMCSKTFEIVEYFYTTDVGSRCPLWNGE